MVWSLCRGQVFSFLLSSFCCGGARLEAEAVIASFNDVAMVRQAIEQRRRHFRVAEHAGPFAEAQVRGDDHAGALVKLAEQMEEQGAARRTEGQIAKFTQDYEIVANQPFGNLTCFALRFFLLERIDQFDGGEEANLFAMMFDGLNAKSCRQVRLSRSRPSDEDGSAPKMMGTAGRI